LNINVNITEIRKTAEEYYRNGDYYCSEAIVKAIKDGFSLDISDTVISLASGFPVGMGRAGCSCGAVAGGVMAIGMLFGRTQPKDEKVGKAMALSKELHDLFQSRHQVVCCRALTKGMELGSLEHMKQCIAFTGEIAEEVAKIAVRELK